MVSERILELEEMTPKTLEKLICACSKYNRTYFFLELKEAYKIAYHKLPVNKALICASYLLNTEVLDKELADIVQKLKSIQENKENN